MKKINYLLWIVGLVIFTFLSCSEDEETNTLPSKPDTYIVGINLGVEVPLTKGVYSGAFTPAYEENYIYLHKKTNDKSKSECIEIPVYTYECQDPNTMRECNGFRYEVKHNEDGSYTLTPIKEDGTKGEGMIVSQNDSFYFSSIGSREWKVNYDENIEHIQKFEAPQEVETAQNELYTRDPKVNKEIYRSINNFTLQQILNLNGDLAMERECSGYSFMALFSTREYNEDLQGYYLTQSMFKTIMGDTYDNWYIKIYLGNAFTANYDMQEKTGIQESGGFYGSTDKTKYGDDGTDDGYYLQFNPAVKPGGYVETEDTYQGMGYWSSENKNYLFAPTNENLKNDFTAFIFIKHWNGPEGSTPDEAWLTSNDNAMYTQVTWQNIIQIGIQNGVFYTCGINIDINELKAAAIANGLISDPTTSTKSIATHDSKPKKFTLHNAETFVNY